MLVCLVLSWKPFSSCFWAAAEWVPAMACLNSYRYFDSAMIAQVFPLFSSVPSSPRLLVVLLDDLVPKDLIECVPEVTCLSSYRGFQSAMIA